MPVSNVDGVGIASPTPLSPSTEADRSMTGATESNGNGVTDSHANNGNGSALAGEPRGRVNESANSTTATKGVANGDGETNGDA